MGSTEDLKSKRTLPYDDISEKEKTEPVDLKQVGPYAIHALLEKGGMSFLYIATHPDIEKEVIVKVLSERFIQNKEVVNRFLKEAEIISLANHEHIVKLYGQGQWEKGLYIAMEYIKGITLRQYILQTPISLKQSIEMIVDIAYALCHLHTHGVIHRDLKPENILVEKNAHIKVIDFGISQLLTEKDEYQKSKQKIIGTPIYMSPEQYANPEGVSFPSDIYSLGIIAYELLLGKLSYGKIDLRLLPRELRDIIKKCLNKDLSKRYKDVVDLITDLNAYMKTEEFKREEKKRGQHLFLQQSLKKMQGHLLKDKICIETAFFEAAFVVEEEASLGGVTYQILQQEKEITGLYLGESTEKGGAGLLHTAHVAGLLNYFFKDSKDIEKSIYALNTLLLENLKTPPFLLSALKVDEKTDQFTFFSCGYENLIHMHEKTNTATLHTTDTLALGIDEKLVLSPFRGHFEQGDTLILSTFSLATQEKASFKENVFCKKISQYGRLPLLSQLENILRYFTSEIVNRQMQHPLALIAIRKKHP
jgi:eukaryotic-like serine/threonine-protein kinase